MWYRVGKYAVMTGASLARQGEWFATWMILEDRSDGSLMPLCVGRDDSINEHPMAAAERALRLGVDSARRLQGDMSLPFEPLLK